MKIKRYIALLLLTAYLFAVGGQALTVLSCRCVTMHSLTVAHRCCEHCDHTAAEGNMLSAPCCENHHSTEIELYTGSNPDAGRYISHIVVAELPAALVAESILCDDRRVGVYTRIPHRDALFPPEPVLAARGLRAPPVLI